MKKLLLFALILTLCVFTFAACGQKAEEDTSSSTSSTSSSEETSSTDTNKESSTETKQAIKVALDACYRPMEWEENGEIVGFDADLIKAIAKEMGREVELKNVGWDDIFDNLHAGQYDLIVSSVSINEERKKSMLFSDPYYDSMQLILTTKDANIKSANDLSKKKVAVQKGTIAEELISKNIAGVKLSKYDSGEDALNSFANKETDAVIIDAPVLLDFAKQKNNTEYTVVTDEKFFAKEQFGIAANKGQDDLIDEINSALGKLKENGEYQKIYDKYFKTN